jgi:hypothetical protein
MPDLQYALQKLRRAPQGLLLAADALDATDWNTPSEANSWSAAHLIAHLCQVQRSVLGCADRVIRKTALHVPYLQRLHVPFLVVEKRLIRRKSPIPIDAELLHGKEAMLAELRSVRGRTLSFMDETHGGDLSVYDWPHPFLASSIFITGLHSLPYIKFVIQNNW